MAPSSPLFSSHKDSQFILIHPPWPSLPLPLYISDNGAQLLCTFGGEEEGGDGRMHCKGNCGFSRDQQLPLGPALLGLSSVWTRSAAPGDAETPAQPQNLLLLSVTLRRGLIWISKMEMSSFICILAPRVNYLSLFLVTILVFCFLT